MSFLQGEKVIGGNQRKARQLPKYHGKEGSFQIIATDKSGRDLKGEGRLQYVGYQFVENDLNCQDWRSRDESWDYCRIAIDFFADNEVPIQRMQPADELVGNRESNNSRCCLAQAGEYYLVYLPYGGMTELSLVDASGEFEVRWFDPRSRGELQVGTPRSVRGGAMVSLGNPPNNLKEDWLVVIRKSK